MTAGRPVELGQDRSTTRILALQSGWLHHYMEQNVAPGIPPAWSEVATDGAQIPKKTTVSVTRAADLRPIHLARQRIQVAKSRLDHDLVMTGEPRESGFARVGIATRATLKIGSRPPKVSRCFSTSFSLPVSLDLRRMLRRSVSTGFARTA